MKNKTSIISIIIIVILSIMLFFTVYHIKIKHSIEKITNKSK